MISYGKSVTTPNEALQRVPIKHLYNTLRNPRPEFSALVKRLRAVYLLDIKQYNQQKKQLPYFVCANFMPALRKKENFASTQYFVVDIDKLSQKQMNVNDVRVNLQQDTRVLMSFVSPSEDGLKLIFKLKEPCFDAGIYSIFYRTFVTLFSKQYGLEQVVDIVTCDVTRACFLSVDSEAYYNESAELIDINAFVNPEDSYALLQQNDMLVNEQPVIPIDDSRDVEHSADPSNEVMDRIRTILNPKAQSQKESQVYVPVQLNMMIDGLKAYIESVGVEVLQIINIQYAKKLQMRAGLKEAEINLFYGKRGFTVVISPRTGTDTEFNELMSKMIRQYVDEL